MTRPADVEALKQLALLGGLEEHVELASGDFCSLLDVSQQTASRRLIELTEGGFIQREMGVRKQRIRISEAGRDLLHQEHLMYQRLFQQRDRIDVVGMVQTGLGEGKYYLSRPGYEQQFHAHLGWTPYPGTLNLELGGAEANKLRFLRRNPVHVVQGFEAEGRTFGGVTCHPARLGDLEVAAILPNRSHYTTVLEVIAPVCLRDEVPCVDGDSIALSIQLQAGA